MALPAVTALVLLAACQPIPPGGPPSAPPAPAAPEGGAPVLPSPVPSQSEELPSASAPYPDPMPSPEPADPAPIDAACHPEATPTLTDYMKDGPDLTRVGCGGGVAVYADPTIAALPADRTDWVQPYLSRMWSYYTTAYGDCSVPRELPVELGPCEDFGAPRPLVLFMVSADPGSYAGTINSRFDDSGFNTLWVANATWGQDAGIRDFLSHEACHIIEGSGRGVNGSPAYPIWGDSRWAEFCQYDMYVNTGATDDAQRVYDSWTGSSTGDSPPGTGGAYWFRDWFYPLWQGGGGNAAVMDRYFQLLSQYFPTRDAGGHLDYARDLTTGEYVLFTGAAAGRDLSDRAAQAFNSGFDRAEYEEARSAFPEVAALAGAGPGAPPPPPAG